MVATRHWGYARSVARGPRTFSKTKAFSRLPPKYQAAGRMVETGWKNRKMIARQGRRAYAKYSNKRRIMNSVGVTTRPSSNRFTALNVLQTTAQATRSLYFYDLTELGKQSIQDEINLRDSDLVNIRGIRINWEITNQKTAPIRFNIAVVVPKGVQAVVNTTKFFKGDSANRGRDFSSSMSSIELATLPINTDNYDVVTHKRFILEPGEISQYKSQRMSYKRIDQWVNIARYFGYNGGTVGAQNRKPYLVYWFDFWGNPANALPSGSACTVAYHSYTIFRNA